ncbi:MAG: hypothetical protein QGI68_01430 [Pseudomonadales bacterium]|jgi:hypothetical protein|nr:hypothetical protein [Pseudomonadales bacterium]MDP7594216.1 hypothetical protein [Pseudomonadales bacterium]HJN52919.1 hypothetical protein [Pseudomonadales bacterium]|tara:strand:+ start:366 stop:854 length:489 start_codon:yes stop_codon:yes gene_type:complete
MVNKKARHLVEELESQFSSLQGKIGKAKDTYIANHQKDYDRARRSVEISRKRLNSARKSAAGAAEKFSRTGSLAAQYQLKKARAAAVLLGESLMEAKEIMSTAKEKLSSARPFEKKLAARAKALAVFEKEWDKKQKLAEKAKAKRAADRKKAAKNKAKAGKS